MAVFEMASSSYARSGILAPLENAVACQGNTWEH